MKQEKNRKKVAFLQLFCIFFLLIAFVLTSSMYLFLTYLGQSMNVVFTQSDVQLVESLRWSVRSSASSTAHRGLWTVISPPA